MRMKVQRRPLAPEFLYIEEQEPGVFMVDPEGRLPGDPDTFTAAEVLERFRTLRQVDYDYLAGERLEGQREAEAAAPPEPEPAVDRNPAPPPPEALPEAPEAEAKTEPIAVPEAPEPEPETPPEVEAPAEPAPLEVN